MSLTDGALDGSMTVTSAAGKGTTVVSAIPAMTEEDAG